MRVIDRLLEFLSVQHIAPYTFEKKCGIANGYLKKQQKGKGTIGSATIGKISAAYRELSLVWLLTGKGGMLQEILYAGALPQQHWREEDAVYHSQEQLIKSLKKRIEFLENAIADKDKIIHLLEKQTQKE